MKTSERLLAMLRQLPELDLPEGAHLARAAGAYSGDGRSGGAWVWTVMNSAGIPTNIGSQWTMTELVRLGIEVNRDSHGDIHIEPTTETQQRLARETRTAAGRLTLEEELLKALRDHGGLSIPEGSRIEPYNTSLVWMVVGPDGRSLRIASRQSMGELLRHGFTVHREGSGLTRVTVKRPDNGRE